MTPALKVFKGQCFVSHTPEQDCMRLRLYPFCGSKPPLHIISYTKSSAFYARNLYNCFFYHRTSNQNSTAPLTSCALFGLLQTLKGPNIMSNAHIPYPNIPCPRPHQTARVAPSRHITSLYLNAPPESLFMFV